MKVKNTREKIFEKNYLKKVLEKKITHAKILEKILFYKINLKFMHRKSIRTHITHTPTHRNS